MSTYPSQPKNQFLYEKLGSNELDKQHDYSTNHECASLSSRSGKSTYLVNAQKPSTVTLLLSVYSILPVLIPDIKHIHSFVFSGQTTISCD